MSGGQELKDEHLYIIGHPEDFIDKAKFQLLKKANFQETISCIIVDEAHCSVMWSHDFRPQFAELYQLRSIFPDAQLLALTGTATPEMRQAIISTLRLRKTMTVTTPVNRENIFLNVIKRPPNSAKYPLEEVYHDIMLPYVTDLAREKLDFPKTLMYCKLQWLSYGDNMTADTDAECHSSTYHASLQDTVSIQIICRLLTNI